MKQIRLAIASDHAGFPLKEQLRAWLTASGYEVTDCGTYGLESVDYPDFGNALAEEILSGKAQLGIAICGSGNGISMALNRHKGIRAALCWLPALTHLARQHNDANVLSLPGRFLSLEQAQPIVGEFLRTEFEGGRHQRRVEKLDR